jgi:4,5:9,10-diseco-3-hydroxy-5,9,17-trioxoandrosta-1(10),2-diene-4-oate hydrolase
MVGADDGRGENMPGATPIPVGQYVTVGGGLRLHLHERGEIRPDRPSILFLHGSGPGASGYSNFRNNIDFFAERGWHVLAPDYLGFGLSDKPRDLEYSSSFHLQTIIEMLAVKGVSSVVPVGNSLGGLIALDLTLSYPEKVAKLILMAPGGVVDPAEWAADMPGLRTMHEVISTHNTDREAFRKVLLNIAAKQEVITDEVIDQRLPIWAEQPPEVYSTMKTKVFGDRLHEIKMPVLCFWGQKDLFLPVAHAAIVAERVADVRVVISSHAGHWFMVEEPDYFNTQIDWFLANA